jgi:ATP-dependent NAD(P)H-hydrate dehydratase
LRVGADSSHVFAPQEAVVPIKSYSPELVVHPWVSKAGFIRDNVNVANSFIIGPGLGRQESAFSRLQNALNELVMVDEGKNLVLDADALWWLKEKRALVIMVSYYCKSGNKVVLTPNSIEFSRLWNMYFPKEEQ